MTKLLVGSFIGIILIILGLLFFYKNISEVKDWIYVKMLDTQELSFWFCATTFIGGSTSRVAYQSEKGF